jgi:hypothetical protein
LDQLIGLDEDKALSKDYCLVLLVFFFFPSSAPDFPIATERGYGHDRTEQLAFSGRDVRVARRKCKSKSAIRRRTGKETLEAGLVQDWTDMADLTIHIPAKNKHWDMSGETM